MRCRFCDITFTQADCVEAGCNYDACGSFRRRLSFGDYDYGTTTYSGGFVCLEGCDPGPAKPCERYADFDCPLIAGCVLGQAQGASSPIEEGPTPTSSPDGEDAGDDPTSAVSFPATSSETQGVNLSTMAWSADGLVKPAPARRSLLCVAEGPECFMNFSSACLSRQ